MYHKHFHGTYHTAVGGCFFPISSSCFSSRFCLLGIPYNLGFDDVCRPSQERCSMATCTVVTGPVERQPFPRKCHCLHFSVLFGKAEQKVFERDVNRKAMVWGVRIISHKQKDSTLTVFGVFDWVSSIQHAHCVAIYCFQQVLLFGFESMWQGTCHAQWFREFMYIYILLYTYIHMYGQHFCLDMNNQMHSLSP